MKLRESIFVALALLCSVSCMQNAESDGDGYIDLRVTGGTELEVVTVSKAGVEGLVYAVNVVDKEGETVFSTPDFNSITEPLRLKTGDYTIVASSGRNGGAASFNLPFYTGQTDVQVRANTISKAEIECRLSTVKVTVEFSQEIKDNFTYSLVVSNELAKLTFEPGTENLEGYFSPTGVLQWQLHLENKAGEKFLVKESIEGVTAHQHYDFFFDLEAESEGAYGAGEFRIVLSNDYNETLHTPTIYIHEDGPTIVGSDDILKYISDQASGVEYLASSSRKYTSVKVSHSNKGLLDAGLPYSSELVSEVTVADFEAASSIDLRISAEDGTECAEIDETAREIVFDLSALLNKLPIGMYTLDLSIVNESGLSVAKTVNVNVSSSVNVQKTVPWAEFIYLKGMWMSDTRPSGMKIQYKKSSESSWTDFNPSVSSQYVVNESNKSFRAFICGLSGSTPYQVRITTDTETLAPVSLTTDTANQLFNFNFEAWHQPDGKTWYPYYQDSPSSDRVWDSANKGSIMAGSSNTEPTSASGEFVKGKAIKMTTIWVSIAGITKLAAGNVYTGRFNKVIGTSGADLDWGVPFKSRPLALKGYYRYAPVKIDKTGDGYGSYYGQMDKCQIQIVLQDAGQPYYIVPTTYNGVSVNGPTMDRNTYVDLSTHSSVIARGVRNFDSTNGTFKEVLLPFTYRSISRTPTHAVITFTSSYLGDYFTGGEDSVMWADEFEYLYDPMELPDDARDSFFSMFD